MMVTAVNEVKSSWFQFFSPFRNEFVTKASQFSSPNCYGTSSVQIFCTTSCPQSYKKFLDIEGKIFKRDGTVERIKTDPQESIVVINSKNEKLSMKIYDAKQMADTKGLNLIQVKSFGKQEVYKMISDKELIKAQSSKLKQFVFKSNISDHDFQIKMRKVAENMMKHGEIQLSFKLNPGDEDKIEFVEKIKNYITCNNLRCTFTQTQSRSRIQTYLIKRIDDVKKDTEKEVEAVNTS